jgi:hypothetical protein
MGLGAGRPELACRLIADSFLETRWTSEAAGIITNDLSKHSEEQVAAHPELSPWEALYVDYKMEPHLTDIEWEDLGQRQTSLLWTALAANAAIWGLTHENEVAAAFEAEKAAYEAAAPTAMGEGLAITEEFPWQSPEDFYQGCEEMVQAFEAERSPFPSIPEPLWQAPLIQSRLRDS